MKITGSDQWPARRRSGVYALHRPEGGCSEGDIASRAVEAPSISADATSDIKLTRNTMKPLQTRQREEEERHGWPFTSASLLLDSSLRFLPRRSCHGGFRRRRYMRRQPAKHDTSCSSLTISGSLDLQKSLKNR